VIDLLILGSSGVMGRLISELALKDDEIDVIAACDVNNIDTELGFLVGTPDPKRIIIQNVNELEKILESSKPDVVVDFTLAHATEQNCLICVKHGIRCVIGTTGLSREFLHQFEQLAKENHAPSVISPNMATGVNILFKIAPMLAGYLSSWDMEIMETHHHRKIDAPSGTALKIGQLITKALDTNFEEIAKFGRAKGPNKRLEGAKNELGFHSIRGGDIAGDHVILFAGPGERIELKHQAHNRYCFAEGAIKAIKFIVYATEDKIYDTSEVLGIT